LNLKVFSLNCVIIDTWNNLSSSYHNILEGEFWLHEPLNQLL